jgi:hypothetical protein
MEGLNKDNEEEDKPVDLWANYKIGEAAALRFWDIFDTKRYDKILEIRYGVSLESKPANNYDSSARYVSQKQ